ncbi:MAG: response regulator transcription factor [Anaerolineae bacterium]|nr:response regulator transcription factor [Anaerolineae bacterium]MDQ7034913.1 response regulator transcription factor [Anaerolineae bacterium]
MSTIIRVLLVDDHSSIHIAITANIEIFDDFEIVGHASNGEEAIKLARQLNPNVILMDVIMPKMGGLEATRYIHEQQPDIKILALSSFQDDDSVRDMLKAGAVGYVLKNSSIDDIAHTIRAAHAGKSVFSQEVTRVLMSDSAKKTVNPTGDYDLTPRELDVLRLLVKGQNNKQIAEELTISLSTAKFHVSRILSKLNASSRVEAVTTAIEHHLVT